jgi:myo-inositol-1(or 4)-monophosphatase
VLARFEKSVMNFATDADIAAEQAILDVLRAACPADAYRGEELGDSGNPSSDRVWLIDPLCGTLNFAAHTPLMAVNVAVRDGDQVRVAASADPIAGEIFWTDGQAAYLRRDGVDSTLLPSAASGLVEVDIDAPDPSPTGFQTVQALTEPAFMAAFRPRVVSTTLALAWVAAGRRAAYLAGGRLRDSVHYASGIAVCQAAGCVVTGLHGQPLHTGSGGLLAAADERTHAALTAVINRQSRP